MNISEAQAEVRKAARIFRAFEKIEEVLDTMAQAEAHAGEAAARAAEARKDKEQAEQDAAQLRARGETEAMKIARRAKAEFDDKAAEFAKTKAEAEAWAKEWDTTVTRKRKEHKEWCERAVAEQKEIEGAIRGLQEKKAAAAKALADANAALDAVRQRIS